MSLRYRACITNACLTCFANHSPMRSSFGEPDSAIDAESTCVQPLLGPRHVLLYTQALRVLNTGRTRRNPREESSSSLAPSLPPSLSFVTTNQLVNYPSFPSRSASNPPLPNVQLLPQASMSLGAAPPFGPPGTRLEPEPDRLGARKKKGANRLLGCACVIRTHCTGAGMGKSGEGFSPAQPWGAGAVRCVAVRHPLVRHGRPREATRPAAGVHRPPRSFVVREVASFY